MQRLTTTRRKALAALLDSHPDPLYGLEIMHLTKVASGSLYPALRDLRQSHLVETEWAPTVDNPDGQPVRYYRLSPTGLALAQHLANGEAAGTSWRQYLKP